MQHLAKRSLALTIAAGGLLAVGASSAVADATATGNADGSPGLVSGNDVQVPVNVPVNVCGITTNVVALLDPAAGDNCSNSGGTDTAVTPPRLRPPVPPTHRTPVPPTHRTPAPPVHNAPAPPGNDTAVPPAAPQAMTPAAATLAKTGAGDTTGYAAAGGTLIAGGALARRLAGRHSRRSS
jgi:small secreted domain DUF320